jgi:hypothetical protein
MRKESAVEVLLDPENEPPVILEATRIAGLSDGALARSLGLQRTAVCNWRTRYSQMPLKRKRVVIEIMKHLGGLYDEMDEGHILTKRAALMRQMIKQLVDMAAEELPPASWRETNNAEAEAYRALHRLGVKRLLQEPRALDE